jgi:hypothetical protein
MNGRYWRRRHDWERSSSYGIRNSTGASRVSQSRNDRTASDRYRSIVSGSLYVIRNPCGLSQNNVCGIAESSGVPASVRSGLGRFCLRLSQTDRRRKLAEQRQAGRTKQRHDQKHADGQRLQCERGQGCQSRREHSSHDEFSVRSNMVSSCGKCVNDKDTRTRYCGPSHAIGIGGTVACPPLPHHRTCGSAYGGSAG